MFLCYILVALVIFQTLYYYYIWFGDLQPMIFDVTIVILGEYHKLIASL